MTGESQGRHTPRTSRFSQAYGDRVVLRTAPDGMLDERAERALHRANMVGEPARAPMQQRSFAASQEGFAEVIDIEYETVLPLPAAPEPELEFTLRPKAPEWQNGNGGSRRFADDAAEPVQPPPPDLEAVAAALAAEMERSGKAAPAEPAAEAVPAAETLPAAPAEPAVTLPAVLPASSSRARSTAQASARFVAGALKQTASFMRAKAAPAAANAAFWVAHNLRRKEIRRRYGKAVVMAHAKLLDRRMDRHFFHSPLKRERFAPDPDRGILYEGPVPAAAFNWALSVVPGDLREFTFVDFRAGLGRAMLLAAKRNFERVVGFEHDRALLDDLQTNIAQFPRSQMVCRDVQCFRADRVGISIPEQPCVLYFANAWREELMEGIMDYLVKSYRYKPRRLYLILENVDDKFALPANDVFTKVELPLAEKLKLRLFSPMDFQVYRTPV